MPPRLIRALTLATLLAAGADPLHLQVTPPPPPPPPTPVEQVNSAIKSRAAELLGDADLVEALK